jgi:hypothetical protein
MLEEKSHASPEILNVGQYGVRPAHKFQTTIFDDFQSILFSALLGRSWIGLDFSSRPSTC